MIIGIDATNIRNGGGVNHLVELLNEFIKQKKTSDRFIVWSNKRTLKKIKDDISIYKINLPIFEKNYLYHAVWRLFYLPQEIIDHKCELLFVPGGSYVGSFSPVVSMCRNILPFDKKEIKRYFPFVEYFKFNFLRYVQTKTFKKSKGVIFLNEYARDIISKKNSLLLKKSKIIPHGINKKFYLKSRKIKKFNEFTKKNPVNIVYVSSIDFYKHQDKVVLALEKLSKKNIPLSLNLIGSPYEPALKRLNKIINRLDKNNLEIKYFNFIEHDQLIDFYKNADIAVFASTCENLPNVVLEYLAAKIPIACSKKRPMIDILENNAEYFHPDCVDSIYKTLLSLIKSDQKREKLSINSHNLVHKYNWENTASKTLDYFRAIIEY
jgi:glycosyltransferase involved in cell wall biosynthesis